MPNVDKNAPLVTNSDAAMWRQDHASAIRYIEALLAERARWAPVIEAAREVYATGALGESEARREEARARLVREAYAAALKEGNADG